MPTFLFNNKLYYNPVEFAMDRIGGSWKMPILWRLRKRVMRYGELKSDIPHITHKMLTSKLRELEEDGFVRREVFPVVPPKVEYSITERGMRSNISPLIATWYDAKSLSMVEYANRQRWAKLGSRGTRRTRIWRTNRFCWTS